MGGRGVEFSRMVSGGQDLPWPWTLEWLAVAGVKGASEEGDGDIRRGCVQTRLSPSVGTPFETVNGSHSSQCVARPSTSRSTIAAPRTSLRPRLRIRKSRTERASISDSRRAHVDRDARSAHRDLFAADAASPTELSVLMPNDVARRHQKAFRRPSR